MWLLLQVARSRWPGRAVRVSEATLTEPQSVFDQARDRLDYHKRVDVYVMDKIDGGSTMTSYLGTGSSGSTVASQLNCLIRSARQSLRT